MTWSRVLLISKCSKGKSAGLEQVYQCHLNVFSSPTTRKCIQSRSNKCVSVCFPNSLNAMQSCPAGIILELVFSESSTFRGLAHTVIAHVTSHPRPLAALMAPHRSSWSLPFLAPPGSPAGRKSGYKGVDHGPGGCGVWLCTYRSACPPACSILRQILLPRGFHPISRKPAVGGE